MGTRIGAFKAKNAQLVIWESPTGISFTFGKHYKDKRTGEWKKTETLYPDELRLIADMFKRAADWVVSTDQIKQPEPGPMARIGDITSNIINKLAEGK